MNSAVIIGRLTRDPELRYLDSGTAVCRFIVAVDKQMKKDKKEQLREQGKPTADFIPVNVWGNMGETSAKYLSKGSKVAVQGEITTGQYKTDSGETRYTTDLTARNVQFLDDKQRQAELQQVEESDFGPQLDDDEVPFIIGWAGGLEEAYGIFTR